MRAYFFGNLYLSSIQQGIQASHTVVEMFNKYLPSNFEHSGECCFEPNKQAIALSDWATNHKTMILLNGGYSIAILNLLEFFSESQNPYPWSEFRESEEALDGALTCIGIILPEKIYDTAKEIRDNNGLGLTEIQNYGTYHQAPGSLPVEITKWEFELIKKLNTFGMAK